MKRIVLVLLLICVQLSACGNSENNPTAGTDAIPYDFKFLQSKNPDIYAWISISNSNIDYPIVQSDTDVGYYLTHDASGEPSDMGAIFTEKAYNTESFDDPITVIYGNRVKTGEMFGNLQKMFSEKNALEKYGEIIIRQPKREIHYTVFAASSYDDRHIMYNYGDGSVHSMDAFIGSITSQRSLDSLTDFGRYPQRGEKIIVLSTCLYGNDDKRFVVAAKELKRNED